MYILGISAFYHDSAACLLKDDEIIAAAQVVLLAISQNSFRWLLLPIKVASLRCNGKIIFMGMLYSSPFPANNYLNFLSQTIRCHCRHVTIVTSIWSIATFDFCLRSFLENDEQAECKLDVRAICVLQLRKTHPRPSPCISGELACRRFRNITLDDPKWQYFVC